MLRSVAAIARDLFRVPRTTENGRSLADDIAVKQISALIDQTPNVIGSNFVNSALLLLVMYDDATRVSLVIWLCVAWSFWGLQYAIWLRRRHKPAPKRVSTQTMRKAIAYAATYGAIWGVAGMLFLPFDNEIQRTIFLVVFAGIGAGATSTLSAYPAVCLAFLTTALTPLALRLMLSGEPSTLVLGVITLGFATYMASTTVVRYRAFVESVMLERKNRRLSQNLTRALENEREASRTKSDFLANMSHELRTPLNAIIGFSGLMAHETYGPVGSAKNVEYVEIIHKSGEHLLSMINDVLDYSKADAGKLTLDESVFDLNEAVQDAIGIIGAQAAAKEIEIVPPSATRSINLCGDARKLTQIMLNLLSNAVKFSPNGTTIRVVLGVTVGGRSLIAVEDEGAGIADVDAALEPFVQCSGAQGNPQPGTGLGLPLVKSMVELHGGELVIDTEPGEGTRVEIYFPAERILSAPKAAA